MYYLLCKESFYQELKSSMLWSSAGERFDSESKSKWDEDWEKSKSGFPFSEKLGEISDKIGSTIDDTINKFRKKERDDSPDRIRWDSFQLRGCATDWNDF